MHNLVFHELSYAEIVLRIILALLVGIAVGAERGRNHHPAGMRTHMLVALGACVVMMAGELLFIQFHPLGAIPDPARMGAQVISGIGFLGAGTILREGLTVKGLTTAASIWAVACLGLTIGAGYYAVALTGAAAVYATLTIFEVLERKIYSSHHKTLVISLWCHDLPSLMHDLNQYATAHNASLAHVHFDEEQSGMYHLASTLLFHGAHPEQAQALFLEKLSGDPNLIKLQSSQY